MYHPHGFNLPPLKFAPHIKKSPAFCGTAFIIFPDLLKDIQLYSPSIIMIIEMVINKAVCCSYFHHINGKNT